MKSQQQINPTFPSTMIPWSGPRARLCDNKGTIYSQGRSIEELEGRRDRGIRRVVWKDELH